MCTLLHVRCLTECPSDIFVLNWIQVNSNFSVYTCLTIVSLVLVTKHVFHTLCLCWSRSLEGLGTAGRLGLKGLLLTYVSQLIVQWIEYCLEGGGEVFRRIFRFPLR